MSTPSSTRRPASQYRSRCNRVKVHTARKTARLSHGPPLRGSGDHRKRSGSAASPDARNPTLPSGSRRPHLVAFSLAMTVLLAAVAAPSAHAQNSTDQWAEAGGTVEVSTTTLTIREGETRSYRLRLTRRLPKNDQDERVEGWWAMLHVDGVKRYDGVYDADGDGENDIRWSPSVGWEFDPSDWPAEGMDDEARDSHWRNVSITALEDDDEEDATIVFGHEVWDHDTYCPDALHPDNLPRVTVRVIDDDGPNAPKPELSIEDATVEEGGRARFEVRLDTESERTVTVRYRTNTGTASAEDYTTADDTLTIPAETTFEVIYVQTTEDAVYEEDETFTMRLSAPSGVTLGNATAEGTITDDDDPPTLSISNATVEEGGTAEFQVTLSGESAVTATVRYSTMDGEAVEGSDYTAIDGGTLTFRPGDGSKTIRVRTREDSAREDAETFTVMLSEPEEATITTGTGTGTINDDDAAALPSLRIEDATVTEGGTASFEVTLSATSADTVTFDYVTVDRTAAGNDDYSPVTTPVTLTVAGQSETITVATRQDQDYEGDETFEVRLSNPSGRRSTAAPPRERSRTTTIRGCPSTT